MYHHIEGAAQRLSRTIGRYLEWSELNGARGSGQLRRGEPVPTVLDSGYADLGADDWYVLESLKLIEV